MIVNVYILGKTYVSDRQFMRPLLFGWGLRFRKKFATLSICTQFIPAEPIIFCIWEKQQHLQNAMFFGYCRSRTQGIVYRIATQRCENKIRTKSWKRLKQPACPCSNVLDLSDNNIRGQVEAFIRVLTNNYSLGARSHRSLKLFGHWMASAETSQEWLLALLNVKATMRPGTMQDK